ncbi:MAG TPA: hypothetical protein VE619_01265 [Nitrososphaeraceae archaeon]|nr:hypothetical protein [Nitrososphaeraceae archaeon]
MEVTGYFLIISGIEEEATTRTTKNDNDVAAKKVNLQRLHVKPLF